MEHDPEKPQHAAQEVEHDAIYAEKAAVADFRAGAIEAENAEHNMTVLEAVRAYPMASFWAFVMSACIVSFTTTLLPLLQTRTDIILSLFRSWNPTMSS